jgi:hypothetical protein
VSEAFKTCPICGASNHRNATLCWNCGTSLSGVDAQTSAPKSQQQPSSSRYDFRCGETDLYEGDLYAVGQRYLYGCFGVLIVLMVIGLGMVVTPSALSAVGDLLTDDSTAEPTAIQQIVRPTVTPGTPTNTPGPPTPTSTSTPTITPTREPCIQRVQAGDLMYDVVARCGHLSFDVFDEVVEINDLDNAGTIFEGQELVIPWPTPTPDPNAQAPPTPEPGADADTGSSIAGAPAPTGDVDVFELEDEELEEFFAIASPTLPPGIQWHVVAQGQTMIEIIALYDASVRTLSDLNPEMSFNQCDMGMTYGGDRCNVMVFQGQQIRVPVPTPTPTLSPTPSGSETRTPTPTATFNAPSALSPPDRALFRRNELVTLRWIPSGTLGPNETYRVIVEDRTAGVLYTADTVDTSMVIPDDWQGTGPEPARHDYAWRVEVINLDRPDAPLFVTETLTFAWETTDDS